MKTYVCPTCQIEKDISNFEKQNTKIGHRLQCKACISLVKKEYYKNNKPYLLNMIENYRKNNPKKFRETQNKSNNKRRANPAVKLRHNISVLIRNAMNKTKISILDFIPYTIQELKKHLENLFEPWMTWDNWGIYDSKTWNDNDQTTWTWQLDHIIPQSLLPYSSMDDENFQKCWGLENLRPLSSKQNLLDGSTRIRHKAA